MLHELLLALQGCPGSLFVRTEENKIKVVEGLLFLHPSETVILKKLCSLGSHFCILQHFKDRNVTPNKGVGLYIAALCRGLNLILNSYTQQLLQLEKECMKDSCISLSHFQYKLNEYQLLFPVLISLLDKIETVQARGCYVLDLIFRYSVSGIPFVQKSFKQILAVCHGVLYKQLTAWLLYGILTDDYNEFFIQQAFNTSTGIKQLNTSEGAMEEKSIPDKTFLLKANLLPSYIPHRVANKILFVGESVQLFSHRNDIKSSTQASRSMFDGKESQFCEQLFNLQQKDDFSLGSFEAILDEIRSSVAEHLWKLVVEESDLIGKLNQLKNYYLLARGELYLAFIDNIDSYLMAPSNSSTEHDVNLAFQIAARSVLLDEKNESEIAKFHFKIRKESLGVGEKRISQNKVESGWSQIGLEYDVSWPLHILFTPPVLSRYEVAFKFLITVKRAQIELHKCWTLQMLNKQAVFEHVMVWQLRNHMSFIVDNLQYYLQVDVLESQFGILIEKINATRDFEEIQHAHEQFLTSILAQTFQLMKPISQCLNEVLNLCFLFCKLVNQSPMDNWMETERNQVDKLTQHFSRQIALLFKILSSVSHQSSPYLAQLLLRIDYNKFLSNVSGQLGI